jgi:hypothetical protein
MPAEDGSGVGAALIAALTLKRVQEGNVAGIRDPEGKFLRILVTQRLIKTDSFQQVCSRPSPSPRHSLPVTGVELMLYTDVVGRQGCGSCLWA